MAVQGLLLTPIIAPLVRWFIPPLLGALSALFRTRLGLWVVSMMSWLGIAFVTHQVVLGPLIDQVKAFGSTSLGGNQWGVWITAWAGVLQFDRAMSAILSAYVTRASVNALKLFLAKRA